MHVGQLRTNVARPTAERPPAASPAARPPSPRAAALAPVVPLSAKVLAFVDAHRAAILLGVVALYVAGFNGQWRPEPDSALYLSIGRSLAEGRGYAYHDQPNHLAYPGLPWLWAGVFAAFGDTPRALVVAHGVILLMGLGCLALCYRLFLLHAARPTAVLMVVGLATSRMFYRYCFELRSDVPFLLGVLAFLAGYEAVFYQNARAAGDAARDGGAPRRGARWYDYALLVAGLAVAVVMRPTMWALLLAAAAATGAMLVRGRVKWGVAGLLVVVLAGALFYKLDPRAAARPGAASGGGAAAAKVGEYEQGLLDAAEDVPQFARKVFTENLPALLDPAAGEAMFGLDFGARLVEGVSLNTLGSLVAIGLGLTLFRHRLLWGLFYVVTVLMMLAVLPLDRYFLAVLPLTVYAWWRALVWLESRAPAWRWAPVAAVVLFGVGATCNFARICEWGFEQHRHPFLARYKGGRFDAAPRFGRDVAAATAPHGWVLGPRKLGRILTFYTHRNVVEPGDVPEAAGRALADARQPLYVINPADDGVARWLRSTGLAPGPAIVSVTGRGGTWALHPLDRAASPVVTPTAAPAAPTAP